MYFDEFEILPVGAAPGGECYLILSDSAAILCDTGFHFCADGLVKNVRGALRGRELDYILLTHSHYDHVLGSIACKQAWPDCEIIASAYAARIFQKPTARALMRQLDRSHADRCGYGDYPDHIDELRADRTVTDGEILNLGRHRVRVVALPGHTKCSIGFYFEENQFLLAPETIGVPISDGGVYPCAFSSYRATVQSLRRLMDLPLRGMLVSHTGVYDAAECRTFFPQALAGCEKVRDLILSAPEEDASQLAPRVLDSFYPEGLPDHYPKMASEINTQAQIDMMRREFAE